MDCIYCQIQQWIVCTYEIVIVLLSDQRENKDPEPAEREVSE